MFQSSIRYALNKIKRLFPLHVSMLFIAFISYVISVRDTIGENVGRFFLTNCIKFILNLFLISDWVPHTDGLKDINGEYNIVTWFLSLCLLMYLLTPLFFRIMHILYRSHRKAAPYVVMAVCFIYTLIFNVLAMRLLDPADSYWHTYESPLSRVGDYLIGCQLGYMYIHRDIYLTDNRTAAKCVFWLSVVISAILVFKGTFGVKDYLISCTSTGFYYTIPVGMLILSLAMLEEHHMDDVLSDRYVGRYESSNGFRVGVEGIFLWLGTISPYEYLIHYPVIVTVHGLMNHFEISGIVPWAIMAMIVTFLSAEMYRRFFLRNTN